MRIGAAALALFALSFSSAAPALVGSSDAIWVRRYDGPSHDLDFGRAVAAAPDGSRVYVTGISRADGTADDYATLAYDAAGGRTLWIRRYNGPYQGEGGGFDDAESLALSPDGTRLFVTGSSWASNGKGDYATIAYEAATGKTLWLRRYDGAAHAFDSATAIGVSPDGSTVFVTGSSEITDTDASYATIAYDAATGVAKWIRRHDGPGGGIDRPVALAVSPDGSGVFVTGSGGGLGSYETVGYDATTGKSLWVRRYDGPGAGPSRAASVAVSPDASRVFVTGTSDEEYLIVGDMATIAYDAATGGRLWLRRYDGPAHSFDGASSLAVSPDGSRLFVAGSSRRETTGYDAVIIAYETASGTSRWVRTHGVPGTNGGGWNRVAVGPDGSRVFATGPVSGLIGGYDYTTIGYDAATGKTYWIRAYDGTRGIDVPWDLEVSRDGRRVYVAGVSTGSFADYATIAYDALAEDDVILPPDP